MTLTPAMSLIQDDWVAQKIEQTRDQAWTKHPETNSCFDVTTAVPAGRRAGGHTMVPNIELPTYNNATMQFCYKTAGQSIEQLRAHSGSGGMTSSLSVGVHGSANVRRLLMFPLSPMLVTGRSDIKVMTPAHPQYHGATATRQDMLQLVDDQWTSRTRPVNSREWIESQLPDNGVVRQTAPVLPAVYE